MDFEGLTTEDLVNVTALNRAWLDLDSQRPAVAKLPLARIERLATAPFLLFSFREHDEDLWRRLLDGSPQADWCHEPPPGDPALGNLQTAGLAFLWELARRNPYVARIVSGAPLAWCNHLASATLADLLVRVAQEAIIRARFNAEDRQLERLLANGVCADEVLREATQLGILHSLLTRGSEASDRRLPAAACSTRAPERKVADEV